MKLPRETREKLLMMAASIRNNAMTATEAVAYAEELLLIVQENGGIPEGFEPRPALPFGTP